MPRRRRVLVFAAVLSLIPSLGSAPPSAAGEPVDFPWLLTAVGNQVFFVVDDGVHGEELWVSDGSGSGTRLVEDIRSGAAGSKPRELTAVGDQLFFSALDGERGRELWISDGTVVGTRLVKDISRPSGSSRPSAFFDVDGIAWFMATTRAAGTELWVSDGTRRGTRLAFDITKGAEGSLVRDVIRFRDRTYIGTSRGDVQHVLRTQGVGERLRSIWSVGGERDWIPTAFAVIKDRLYFWSFGLDRWGGHEYVTDGTRAGTMLLADSVTSFMVPAGDTIVFTRDLRELWRADGTSTTLIRHLGTFRDARELTAFGDIALFVAGDGPGGTTGVELWSTDGTLDGTGVVVDINPPSSSLPQELTVIGDHVFFEADGPGSQGRELWWTDGTADGTDLVENIAEEGSSFPSSLTAVSDRLFFVADDGTHGPELWVSDGTTAGTQLVEDIVP